jgi:epoxyqueuosine reductase
VGAAEVTVLPVAALRALAQEARFDLCGFARAEPIPPEHLVGWLEAGYAADMDWMGARAAERLDVARLLPGARTVVSFACNYRVEHAETAGSPIAQYARGRDYHATLRDRVRAFRRGLRARFPGVETYAGVDATPLMEKVWAVRAGLGHVGKNGCLITREYGSWVVLATMVLDAEVDAYADGVAPDRCGPCRLCITHCPTEAIQPGRRVDARACLSYQTIENEQQVPLPLRAALGTTVFGCDICQQVCPLNRAPVPTVDARFLPRPVAGLTVRELAGMDRATYDALVPGTALARAGFDSLRRNAAYALGAARDAGAREVLARLLRDEEPVRVREAARWALGQLEEAPRG